MSLHGLPFLSFPDSHKPSQSADLKHTLYTVGRPPVRHTETAGFVNETYDETETSVPPVRA